MSLAHLTCPTKSWSSAVTAYRRLHSLYPRRTHTRVLLTGFAFSCSASSSSSSSVAVRRSRNAASSISSPRFYQQNLGYGRFAYDEYASEDSDGEFQSSSKQLVNSTYHADSVYQLCSSFGNAELLFFFLLFTVNFTAFPSYFWELCMGKVQICEYFLK